MPDEDEYRPEHPSVVPYQVSQNIPPPFYEEQLEVDALNHETDRPPPYEILNQDEVLTVEGAWRSLNRVQYAVANPEHVVISMNLTTEQQNTVPDVTSGADLAVQQNTLVSTGIVNRIFGGLKNIFVNWESLYIILAIEILVYSAKSEVSITVAYALFSLFLMGVIKSTISDSEIVTALCSLFIVFITIFVSIYFALTVTGSLMNNLFFPYIFLDFIFMLTFFMFISSFILFHKDNDPDLTPQEEIFPRILGLCLTIPYVVCNFCLAFFRLFYPFVLDLQNLIILCAIIIQPKKIKQKTIFDKAYLILLYFSIYCISTSAKLYLGELVAKIRNIG